MNGRAGNRTWAGISAPQEPDYNDLKMKTIAVLERLGDQKFSESGAYSLENWTKGVCLLLDEFEERMGAQYLTPEYSASRRQLVDRLATHVDLTSIDGSIFELRGEIAETTNKIDAARKHVIARIREIQKEVSADTVELDGAKRRLSVASQQRPSRFGRLFRRDPGHSTQDSGAHLKELESTLKSLNAEMLEQKEVLRSIDRRAPGSPVTNDWNRLDSMEARLRDLEGEREERAQLVNERRELTASIASEISKISAPPGGTSPERKDSP